MNGVVLWHDNTGGTAVIWCEDHADLAYFSAETDAGALGSGAEKLAAGDLVVFDVMVIGRQRRASNLRRLAPGTPLADHLLQAAMAVETGELGRALRAALRLPECDNRADGPDAASETAEVIDWKTAQARKVS
ncbi:hypothetical protein [Shimia sagamensis]|uniref:Uncharacterized protein n=1 Tax=Shimia sagamensis TaxID=1566352 RepID=A0ABY1P2W8_9RHOB|nr:hypothetical protein [Shimia sagamensis]SMP22734.1 hypothetical protein SAMN06265373_104253 [Shimia sagamensis]